MGRYIGRWAGGRIRETREGARFVIEHQSGGKRVRITLEARSEADALAELALYRRDREGFQTPRQAKRQAAGEAATLHLDLVKRYLAWLRGEAQGSEKLTEKYVQNVAGYLAWWDEQLGAGADLRSTSTARLETRLEGVPTAYRKRVMALKGYATWLRTRAHILHPSLDPTLALTAPVPAAERMNREKGYSVEHVEAVYRQLDSQVIRDVVRFHVSTGAHNTELRRLCTGDGAVHEVVGHGEIAGVLVLWHKTKKQHRVSVGAETLAAVKRLIARGGAPEEKWVTHCLHEASAAVRLPEMNYGELRHSFTAWAESGGRVVYPSGAGVPLAQIAAALGHANTRTTSVNYRVTAVPPMVVVPVRLFHSLDPLPLPQQVPDRGAPQR
jgi:integrase